MKFKIPCIIISTLCFSLNAYAEQKTVRFKAEDNFNSSKYTIIVNYRLRSHLYPETFSLTLGPNQKYLDVDVWNQKEKMRIGAYITRVTVRDPETGKLLPQRMDSSCDNIGDYYTNEYIIQVSQDSLYDHVIYYIYCYQNNYPFMDR